MYKFFKWKVRAREELLGVPGGSTGVVPDYQLGRVGQWRTQNFSMGGRLVTSHHDDVN